MVFSQYFACIFPSLLDPIHTVVFRLGYMQTTLVLTLKVLHG